MRPSPSPSEAAGLFDGVLARGRAAAATADDAWLQAMLDVEAALARALAASGLIAGEEAEAIAAACRAERFDAAEIGAAARVTGNPAAPLARALGEAVEGSAAAHVHRGATSQDILDTAAMLVARRALEPLLEDLDAAAVAAATLARAHASTPVAGRTLLQQAVPVTFGLKAAGWLAELAEAAAALRAVRERLPAQLGGAAGTLATLDDAGPRVLAAYAAELDLAEPVLAWHGLRGRVGELAGALGVAAGAAGKVARDVTLLAQTEVAEAREAGGAGRGGSSTMPHKRNPVAAICAVACARQAPGLVATLLASMIAEHERAAGAWHAEWRPFSELLRATGSAAAWLRECLEQLEVDPARMRANLDVTGGLVLAERVSAALAGALGRAQVAALLDPAAHLGSARAFVERALEAYEP